MSLTTEEIGLLRSLVEWRRKTGWTLEYRRERTARQYRHLLSGDVDVFRHTDLIRLNENVYELAVWYVVQGGTHHLPLWPRTVVEALEVLSAIGVLPREHFSSAFQAGRDSLYDRIEYRVTTPVGSRPGSLDPVYSAIEAFKWLGFWRRNGWHDAYLEQRFDKEPSDWVRVPEAGGTDA